MSAVRYQVSGFRFQLVLCAAVLTLSSLSAAQAPKAQTFTGIITDSMCATGDHSKMQMGPTDADCVKACIEAHGATYVLTDGTKVYELSDQKTPEKFAAQKVTVTGTLDPKTNKITVRSITAAK